MKHRRKWVIGPDAIYCNLQLDILEISIADLESEDITMTDINIMEKHFDILWVNELFNFSPYELVAALPPLYKAVPLKIQEALSSRKTYESLRNPQKYRLVG